MLAKGTERLRRAEPRQRPWRLQEFCPSVWSFPPFPRDIRLPEAPPSVRTLDGKPHRRGAPPIIGAPLIISALVCKLVFDMTRPRSGATPKTACPAHPRCACG